MLSRAGFNRDDVQIDPERPTGTVQVELDSQGVPSFTILEDVAYDRISYDEQIGAVLASRPSLIYFGSLVQRTDHGFSTLHKILESRHSDSLCLYDMNLRPGCVLPRILERSLQAADIVKLNREELHTAAEMFDIPGGESDAAAGLMTRFALSMIALTRGADGSEIYVGKEHYGTAAAEPANIVDTVGAGDAYAAVLAAGVLKRWRPERILSTAARFSSRICTIGGAIPEDFSFYRDFRADMKGPADA